MLDIFAQIIDNPGLPQVGFTNDTLSAALTTAFTILGGISLIIVALQGLRYAMSSGDPQKTKQAKDGIIYAMAGIVIALMGASIAQFVLREVLEDQNGQINLSGSDSIFTNIAMLISFATGIISVIMIIIAGIKYNLSNGDPQKTASAKNTIIYALVGVVISAVASPLIIFIIRQVTG